MQGMQLIDEIIVPCCLLGAGSPLRVLCFGRVLRFGPFRKFLGLGLSSSRAFNLSSIVLRIAGGPNTKIEHPLSGMGMYRGVLASQGGSWDLTWDPICMEAPGLRVPTFLWLPHKPCSDVGDSGIGTS